MKGKLVMKQIKSFAFKSPIVFVVVVYLIITVTSELSLNPLVSFFKQFINDRNALYSAFIVEEFTCAFIGILLIKGLGIWKTSGITKPREWKQVWLFTPVLVWQIAEILTTFDQNTKLVTTQPLVYILLFILNIGVGLGEEVIGRGLALNLMMRKWGKTKKGIYFSVFASSIIFGLIHFATTLAGRHDLLSGIFQVIYCMFYGVFFCACVLRNNSIWPMVFYHFLVDFVSALCSLVVSTDTVNQNSLLVELIPVIIGLSLFIYGLILLRKVKPVEV